MYYHRVLRLFFFIACFCLPIGGCAGWDSILDKGSPDGNYDVINRDSLFVTSALVDGLRPIVYRGDDKVTANHIVNAVVCSDGTIIATRAGGCVVKITKDGLETTLLTIKGASDWRGLFIDDDNNVYASPHASVASSGGFSMADRGLYKLPYGKPKMYKVISLYDPESPNIEETCYNDDTIWTLCQDDAGYLYAGVYSHTQRNSPRIYRSDDRGDNWFELYDFRTIIPQGKHVHSIVYNQYDNCLYSIVGEVNTVLRSRDHGETWEDLHVQCEEDKGSALLAVNDGLLIGSDSAYGCRISKLYNDGIIRTNAYIWANTVFALRRSDYTGWIYAFTKIDSSINSPDYMPPVSAIDDSIQLNNWVQTNPIHYKDWKEYNNRIIDAFPKDAVRPQHCGILISKDEGETWSILYKEYVGSNGPSGYWTTGYFYQGEILTGFFKWSERMMVHNPIIISEKHLSESSNEMVDVKGDVFAITNASYSINPLNLYL